MRLVKEKLIGIGGEMFPKFNQILFLAGGGGSGKGYVLHNILGIDGKILDTDEISGAIAERLTQGSEVFLDRLQDFVDAVRKYFSMRSKKKIREFIEEYPQVFKYIQGETTVNPEGDESRKTAILRYMSDIQNRILDIRSYMRSNFDPENPEKLKEMMKKRDPFLDSKNPKDVGLRYHFKKFLTVKKDWWDKPLEKDDVMKALLASKSQGGRRPNIILDTTLKDPDKIKSEIDLMNAAIKAVSAEREVEPEYIDPQDVSLVWVLTPQTKAIAQNAGRSRSIGIDTLKGTHKGSITTMKKLLGDSATVFGGASLRDYLDGQIIIVFNNGQGKELKTVSADGRTLSVITQYCACVVKEKGKPVTPLSEIENLTLFGGDGKVLGTVGDLVDFYTAPALIPDKYDDLLNANADAIAQAKATGDDIPIHNPEGGRWIDERPFTGTTESKRHGLRLKRPNK